MKEQKIFIHSAYESFNFEAQKGLNSSNTFGSDLYFTFREIFKKIKKHKHLIFCLDPYPEMPNGSILLYLDLPRIKNQKETFINYCTKNKKINNKIKIWILEPYSVRSDQYEFIEKFHFIFDSILTCSEDIFKKYKNSKYLYYPTITFNKDFNKSLIKENNYKNEFITKQVSVSFIGSNKSSFYPLNGYHLRIYILSAIHEITKNMYIYGNGWDEAHLLPIRPNTVRRIAKKTIPKISNLGIIMGTTEDKYNSIRCHHYSLCLENEIGTKGWITEKIFDVLNQLRIPIVFKTDEYFPKKLQKYVIEISKFSSIQELVNYLIQTYNSGEYLKKITSLHNELQKSKFQEEIIDSCFETITK